jgi:hypothetical protein
MELSDCIGVLRRRGIAEERRFKIVEHRAKVVRARCAVGNLTLDQTRRSKSETGL